MQAQREDHVNTQEKMAICQAEEGGLRRNPTCSHLDGKLLASRAVSKSTTIGAASRWYFVMAGQANKYMDIGRRGGGYEMLNVPIWIRLRATGPCSSRPLGLAPHAH